MIFKPGTARKAVLSACLLLASGIALAQTNLLDRRVAVDVSSQKASSAIIELSRQAGVQVIMPGVDLDTHRSPDLRGQMPLGRALEKLLPSRGYRVRQTGTDTITIDPKPAELAAEAKK